MEASGANCSSSSAWAHAASRARRRAPSTRVAASARSRAIDWNEPIGWPNCTRSLAYSTPMARAASPRPTRAPLIRVRHSSRAVRRRPGPIPRWRARCGPGPGADRSARDDDPRLARSPPRRPPPPRRPGRRRPWPPRLGRPGRRGPGAPSRRPPDGGRPCATASARRSESVEARGPRGHPTDARARRPRRPRRTARERGRPPICSQTSSRSSRDAPPPPSFSGTPMVGPAMAQKASHSPASKPSRLAGAHDVGRASVGEEGADGRDDAPAVRR